LTRRKFIKILITAGPTIEPIDPVRFISNRSTGRMGYEIAGNALKRGHEVTLISGPVKIPPPKVRRFIQIETAGELLKALAREIKNADCLIMAAAVGDFRPQKISNKKIKRKNRLSIILLPNKDILREMAKYKGRKLFIGFSLETENLIRNSHIKLKNKNLDLIVANILTKRHNPFGDNKLNVCLIGKNKDVSQIKKKNKAYIAHVLLDKIEELWYLKNNKLWRPA
jgi:phosphopantothenoylcysteine decarboxylase / phosphopantothenate---cysteine ligase